MKQIWLDEVKYMYIGIMEIRAGMGWNQDLDQNIWLYVSRWGLMICVLCFLNSNKASVMS